MSMSGRPPRHPKKSAFSCEVCRKRKVKCDGGHPVCERCSARGDTCEYKLTPTLSYTQRLEARVAELEAALAEAQKDPADGLPEDAGANSPFPSSIISGRADTAGTGPLRVEGSGNVLQPESTSLFQLPGAMRDHDIYLNQVDTEADAKKERLVNSAWRERAFEKLADTPEPYRSLMDSHFCWIQPLFNFIYRPAFTRDMNTGGPYFSKALLNAVLAHSVRWCRSEPGMLHMLAPFADGAAFAETAVDELFDDIKHGNSKIPTIQALLLLSAQQCGCGNRSQAWLYSGMAFRLIDDLGICVDGKRYANASQFSTEDIEVRNRLFWSCYFWDKLIALYFGRTPMIQDSEISPPRILMDDTAEIEPWVPHGLPSGTYPPKQAHSISCFIQMCALAEILNQILINLYSPSRTLTLSQACQCALAQGLRLREWWRQLPQHLKIDLVNSSLDCPPSHIVILNCLYHTINILLNRAKLKLSRDPELASTLIEHRPLIQCVSSATSIVALLDLYTRAFGEGHVVLSLAYSVYTAASIFLLECQALGQSAPNMLERLLYCVGLLERLKSTNPVINVGLDLIYAELESLNIRAGPVLTSHAADTTVPKPTFETPFVQVSRNAYTVQLPHTSSYSSVRPQGEAIMLDSSLSNTEFDNNLGYDLFNMPAEMYDAFLQIEPLSVTMNPGFDIV